MLIDMNAYLGHWPFRKLRHNTAPELVALMDDRGIDLACVSSASAIFYKNSQAGNEDLAAEVADHPDRLIPFAVINPTYADWEHDLSVCAESFGVKGLRLYPNYHNYTLADPCCHALVRAATELGLVVSMVQRQIDQRQRHWLLEIPDLAHDDVASLVAAHPDAKFALLNGLGFSGSRLGRADGDLPDNYVIGISRLTAVMAAEMRVLMDNLGPDRLVFGSGMPFKYPDPPMVKLEVLDATDEEKELIRSGNAAAMLGL